MRPGQSSKRMRGRPNGRGKGPNPLTRSYESSGPDVKIRGTAQHIGEKYLQLARDAQASGDPVMAESYLQHAEHYFRLIASAQQGQQQLAGSYPNQPADPATDEGEEDADFGGIPDRFASTLDRLGSSPQPAFLPQLQPPGAQAMPERPPQGTADRQGIVRPERPLRPERPFPDRNFRERESQPPSDRSYPEHRGFPERNGRGRDQENRGGHGRGLREFHGEGSRRAGPRPDLPFPGSEIESNRLPAFITAPVRLAAEADDPASANDPSPSLHAESPELNVGPGNFPLRPRRRRPVRVESDVGGFEGGAAENGAESSDD